MICIGKLISDKRKEKGLTQVWLGNHFNYSETFFSKIENDSIPVPPSIRSELSMLLECDINHIYMYSHIFSTYNEYCLYFELKEVIINSKIELIPQILSQYKITESTLQSLKKSELYFMIVYANALNLISKDKQYTVEYCCYHLDIELDDIHLLNPGFDREISVYIILIASLFDTKHEKVAFNLSTLLYNYLLLRLESNYTHAEQNIELHTIFLSVINNHAHMLFSLSNYDTSLYFCNQAIQKAIDYHLLFKAKSPYLLKLQIYYQLDMLDDALYCLNQLQFISTNSNFISWDSLNRTLRNKYPRLFTN